MAFSAFYELDAWKKARVFKRTVYGVIKRFPDHERYELTSQLRRSVRSIATNISEGHGRRTPKDQQHFCVIARGSHSETLNHIVDAYDCGYITEEELIQLKEQWNDLGRVINGYMAYLKSRTESKTPMPQDVEEPLPHYESKSEMEIFISHLNN